MKVKILVGGDYMGYDLKAVTCIPGDALTTKDWYGESIIKSGLAEATNETDQTEETKEEPKDIEISLVKMPKIIKTKLAEAGITTYRQLVEAKEKGSSTKYISLHEILKAIELCKPHLQ